MDSDFIRIGRRIRKLRCDRRLSQAELAVKVGLTPQYISNVETGKKKASLKALMKIADELGVSVDLLTGSAMERDDEQNVEYGSGYGYYELSKIMEGCTKYERQVIFETIVELKRILKENRME